MTSIYEGELAKLDAQIADLDAEFRSILTQESPPGSAPAVVRAFGLLERAKGLLGARGEAEAKMTRLKDYAEFLARRKAAGERLAKLIPLQQRAQQLARQLDAAVAETRRTAKDDIGVYGSEFWERAGIPHEIVQQIRDSYRDDEEASA